MAGCRWHVDKNGEKCHSVSSPLHFNTTPAEMQSPSIRPARGLAAPGGEVVEEGEETARKDGVTGSANGDFKEKAEDAAEEKVRSQWGKEEAEKRETREYKTPCPHTRTCTRGRNKRVTTVQLFMLGLLWRPDRLFTWFTACKNRICLSPVRCALLPIKTGLNIYIFNL